MSYSNLYFRKVDRKAYFVSLGIIILSIFTLTSFRFMEGKKTRASQRKINRIEIVNLGSQGAGIFWQTKDPTVSWLIYGKNKRDLNHVEYDSRDIGSNQKERFNHYVELDQLENDSDYFFKLLTKEMVIDTFAGKPLSFHTLASRMANIAEKPAYGKVINQKGEAAVGKMVILKTAQSLPLFTFTKSTGEWLIPLSRLVDKKTKDYLVLSPTETINIEIFDETNLTSHITTNKNRISPLGEPTILGKDYFLTKTEENVLAATDINKGNKNSSQEKIRIIYPKKNSIIPDSSPLIKGTAYPLQEVVITIKGRSVYTAKVKTDKLGVWSLMTPISLDPGKYKLSIKTNDKKGNAVIKERELIIAKSGEQVLGEATGSAAILSPTPTVPPPTPTNKIVATPSPQPTSQAPISGFNIEKLSITGASLITVGLGLFLVF